MTIATANSLASARNRIAEFLVEWFPPAVFISVLAVFWYYIVILDPISFWGIPTDAPVMSLAHGVNIDFWLREPGPRAVTDVQFYQPGMYYQFLSYFLYRLTSPSGTPHELFNAAMRDPQSFWTAIQIAPLIINALGLLVLWRLTRGYGLIYRIAVLISYFVSARSVEYGTFVLFNESFTLDIAIIFFSYALSLLSKDQPRPLLHALGCGLLAGALYMHKMNYVVWGLSMIPAWFVLAFVGEATWKQAIARSTIYVAGLIVSVVTLGHLLLGRAGFHQMIEGHLAIFHHTGVYGNGREAFITIDSLVENFSDFWRGDSFHVMALAICALGALWLLLRDFRDRDWLRCNLPQAALVFGAMALSLLGILKHWQPHYTVSVAAILPFALMWLYRAGAKLLLPAVLALSLLSIHAAILELNHNRHVWAKLEKDTQADVKVILSRHLEGDEARIWVYRIVNAVYQRGFLVDFTAIKALRKDLRDFQGNEFNVSPWRDNVSTPEGDFSMKQLPWKEVVIDKNGIRWLDAKQHPWILDPEVKRIDLTNLVVFERSTVPPIARPPAQPQQSSGANQPAASAAPKEEVHTDAGSTETPFDEQWYLSQYPDVRAAIKNGSIKTALEHYRAHGAAERRLPAKPTVDEEWYLSQNPDVRAAIQDGRIKSALEHYVASGYRERRLPSKPVVDESWYLLTYPDVAQAIRDGRVKSAYDHFVQFGYREKRVPVPFGTKP